MRIRIIHIIACLALISVLPGLVFGAHKFGVIFDVMGDATLISSKGKVKALKRSKHILSAVREGDTIKLNGTGKVVIVSIKDKIGYVITHDAEIIIEGDTVKAVKGDLQVKEGFSVPQGGAKGPIGAIVLRNSIRKSCIEIVSPFNTSVITYTPTLKWKNSCKGLISVSVKVLEDRTVVFDTVTKGTSVQVAAGTLKPGITYRWLVDGGASVGIVGGTFTTVEQNVIDLVGTAKGSLSGKSELPELLSYLFMLLENDLNEMADIELAGLERKFPDNEYIKEIREQH